MLRSWPPNSSPPPGRDRGRLTPVVQAVQRATWSIPVVMFAVSDPVGMGFVASLSRPGGNITGRTAAVSEGFMGKQMELIKETIPTVSHVGLLFNAGNRGGRPSAEHPPTAPGDSQCRRHRQDDDRGEPCPGPSGLRSRRSAQLPAQEPNPRVGDTIQGAYVRPKPRIKPNQRRHREGPGSRAASPTPEAASACAWSPTARTSPADCILSTPSAPPRLTWTADHERAYRAEIERRFRARTPPPSVLDGHPEDRVLGGDFRAAGQ